MHRSFPFDRLVDNRHLALMKYAHGLLMTVIQTLPELNLKSLPRGGFDMDELIEAYISYYKQRQMRTSLTRQRLQQSLDFIGDWMGFQWRDDFIVVPKDAPVLPRLEVEERVTMRKDHQEGPATMMEDQLDEPATIMDEEPVLSVTKQMRAKASDFLMEPVKVTNPVSETQSTQSTQLTNSMNQTNQVNPRNPIQSPTKPSSASIVIEPISSSMKAEIKAPVKHEIPIATPPPNIRFQDDAIKRVGGTLNSFVALGRKGANTAIPTALNSNQTNTTTCLNSPPALPTLESFLSPNGLYLAPGSHLLLAMQSYHGDAHLQPWLDHSQHLLRVSSAVEETTIWKIPFIL